MWCTRNSVVWVCSRRNPFHVLSSYCEPTPASLNRTNRWAPHIIHPKRMLIYSRQSMAPPAKYPTEEERTEARRRSRREYYQRYALVWKRARVLTSAFSNAERERARSRDNWRSARDAARNRPRSRTEPSPLPHTYAVCDRLFSYSGV